MSQLNQKPTVEQVEFADKLFKYIVKSPAELIADRDLTRDLAVEGAAIERVANACNESDGWDMHPKDYYKLVRRLITPAHITALAAHDREREDRMLKRFEELAGKFKYMQRYYYRPCDLAHSDEEESPTWANVSQAHRDSADELLSTIASIRKERSDA